MGVALPLPGRGGGISPHIAKISAPIPQTFQVVFQRFLHLFYARKGILWD